MAKEMMIIFVYDVQMVQREEDDPLTAILYFQPEWVSDQQKVALCGQLMGAARCVNCIFGKPKIISLQSGRFYLKEYGRYILAVGTDRNITDWLLEQRAKTIMSLLDFYHNGIENLAEIYKSSGQMSIKLYQFFETYHKYFLLGGNLFCHITTMNLSKSADGVFMESVQFLQRCRDFRYVLGGCLLFHNKVVASQLNAYLTKKIVLTDPHRIKSSAEIAAVNFELPVGVKLIQVYLGKQEYLDLAKNMQKEMTDASRPDSTKDSLKTERSIIFTSVPEEDTDSSLQNVKPTRPNSLNLRKTTADIEPRYFVRDKRKSPDATKKDILLPNLEYLNISTLHESKKSASASDVCELTESIDNSITTKYYKSHLETSGKTVEDIHTLADPCYPYFKSDGVSISNHWHKEYLSKQKESTVKSKQSENFDPGIKRNGTKCTVNGKWSKDRRKSLNLPLKAFGDSDASSSERRHSSGVVMTPLMTKLSMPDNMIKTPINKRDFPHEFKTDLHNKNTQLDSVKCVLFVCGVGDIVVAIMFDQEICYCKEVVLKLWNTCIENLGRLDLQLRKCLEMTAAVNSSNSDSEPYSYLFLDPEWDMTKRGGPWGSTELGTLTYLHRDFKNNPDLSEILMRYHDGVIYGNQCEGSEVFYHQSAEIPAGLPTATDAMAQVSVKAKRKLEKDHSIIIP